MNASLRRRAPLAGVAAAVTLAAGCTLGPDHVRPPVAVDLPPAFTAAPAAPDSAAVAPADTGPAWWTAFGDSTLDRLAAEALEANQDLRRAAARVLEARALLGGAASERWPRVDVGGSASRSRTSLSAFGGRGTIDREFYDANLTARYELDLWGRLARGEEAARAILLQDELNRRVVVQTLLADVVRTWLLARELQCQLDLTRRTVASYRNTVAMVEERYARGVVPAFEVHLARQNLLTAQAAEPEQERLLAETVRRLEILAGRYPAGRALDGGPASGCATPDRSLPPPLPPVPAGLPADLVARRPDVLAAEAGLHAATAGIGAAKARLLPTLNLTGSAGSVSSELSGWFEGGTDVWSLAAGLVMPLINRGATKAQVRAAEARAEQALAAYQQTLLIAFGEVENALGADFQQARRERLLAASVAEAERALELAGQRYGAGLDNLLSTLEAQRRLLSATSLLLSTQRAHRTARVNLILALGGPWDAEAGHAREGDRE